MLAQSIDYKEGLGAKQAAWMLHSAVLGAMVAPLCVLGGPILMRAAWYTAGLVGGLSTIAVSLLASALVYNYPATIKEEVWFSYDDCEMIYQVYKLSFRIFKTLFFNTKYFTKFI